jgi:hypothetical protein
MKNYLRDQVDWKQPLRPDEYARRRAALREALTVAHLDAL